MEIIVFIKQVPDTADIKIDPNTNTLVREGVRAVVNVFDLNAIETALKLREDHGGYITVITMGPPQAKKALQHALAMGVDEAVLLSSRSFAGSDTWATSYALSQSVRRVGHYDLLICGKQAIDGDTAQVGPGIAAHLNIPQVTYVRKIDSVDDKSITVERQTEVGSDIIRVEFPCLITVLKEMNIPRFTGLKGKIKAKRSRIKTLNEENLECDLSMVGLDGSPTEVNKIFAPPQHKACKPVVATDENMSKVVGEVGEFLVASR